MFVRTHTPVSFRIWARDTVIRFVLYAVVPALIFAFVVARNETRPRLLDLGETRTPRVALHETP